MPLIFRREQGAPQANAAGIDAGFYRRSGLIRGNALDPQGVADLLSHLADHHGIVAEAPEDLSVHRIPKDSRGAYPFDTHTVSPEAAKLLRLHGQLHAAWGHDPETCR